MRIKRLSSALTISVVCHIVVVIIAGFHLVAQERPFKDLLGTEILLFQEAPKPKVRKPVAAGNSFTVKREGPISHTTTPFVVKSNFSPQAQVLSEPSSITVLDQSQPMVPGLNMEIARVGAARPYSPQVKALRSSQVVLNPPNGAAYDDVFFKGSGTNPFIDTEDDAFSTFGMDVDTASYTVMRRYLRDGILPPSEAVRVEDFVNAFDYNYTPPSDEAFAVHLEGAPSKFGEGKRLQLLRVGIQGRVIPDTDRKMQYLPL